MLRVLHPNNLFFFFFYDQQNCWRCISSFVSLIKTLSSTDSQYQPLRNITRNQPPVRLHTTDHNILSLAILPIFHLPYWTFFQYISHLFVCQGTMRDCVKGLAKVTQHPLLSPCSRCHPCHHRKAFRLVKHDFPLLNANGFFWITLFFFMYLYLPSIKPWLL